MTIREKRNNTIIDYSLTIENKVFTDFIELTDEEEREFLMLSNDVAVDDFISQIASKYNIYEKIRIDAICTDKIKQIKSVKTFFKVAEIDDDINIDFAISFPDINLILEKKYTLLPEEKIHFEYLKVLELESEFLSKLAEKYNIYNQIFNDNLNVFITHDVIDFGFYVEFDANNQQFQILQKT